MMTAFLLDKHMEAGLWPRRSEPMKGLGDCSWWTISGWFLSGVFFGMVKDADFFVPAVLVG